LAQDTQIFCGCKPNGLCLEIIRVPVELAGSQDLRLVAEHHADRVPGRVVASGTGYAAIECGAPEREPQPHSRRAPGAVE
jgi:hypothetical protein